MIWQLLVCSGSIATNGTQIYAVLTLNLINMSNVKITIEISDDADKKLHISDVSKQREQFIAFAKFAKSYQSSRKVEKAWEQWIQKQ